MSGDTQPDGTFERRYNVPHYRMRALCRRLDSLSAACAERGVEIGYEVDGDILHLPEGMAVSIDPSDFDDDQGSQGGSHRHRRRQRREGVPSGFLRTGRSHDAPNLLMDHVTVRDGVKGDGSRIVAVIDREAQDVCPLSVDDELGKSLAHSWWKVEMDRNYRRYKRYLEETVGDITEGIDMPFDSLSLDPFEQMPDDRSPLLASELTCSVCGRPTKGGTTYLVMDEESEELLQVGGCCISKHAHGLPARLVARYAAILSKMALHSTDEGIETLPVGADAVYASAVMVPAIHETKTRGFATWRDMIASCTWRLAMSEARSTTRSVMEGRGDLDTTSGRALEAQQALEWARQGFPELPPGRWLKSLTDAASEVREGFVECRFVPSLAQIAPLWLRQQAYLKVRELSEWIDPSGSDWVGEEGKRVSVSVVHIERISRARVLGRPPVGEYVRDTNALLTDAGDVLVWRTTLDLTGVANAISQESPVTLRATVARHREYLGMRETQVTRGQLLYGGQPLHLDHIGT